MSLPKQVIVLPATKAKRVAKQQRKKTKIIVSSPMPMNTKNVASGLSRNQRRKLRRNRQGTNQSRDPNLPRWGKGEFQPTIAERNENPYCMCLINPKISMCRVPDSFKKCTALVRSVQVFNLQCNFNASADSGRFAALFQPIIGDEIQLSHAQNLIVSGANQFPTDFTQVASYQTTQQGISQLTDQFFADLILPPMGIITWEGPGGGSGLIGPNPVLQADATYSLAASTSTTGTADYFFLPVGTYFCTIGVSYGGTGVANTNFYTAVALNTATVTLVTDQNGESTAGIFYGQTSTYIVTVGGPRSGLQLNNNSGTTGIADNSITFVTAYVPGYNTVLTTGNVSTIRPVAMSVLSSSILSILEEGGTVNCGVVPGNTIDDKWLVQSFPNDLNCIAKNENLGKLVGVYNGVEKKGCYAWWAPVDDGDITLFDVNTHNDHDYSAIVIAGKCPTPANVTGAVDIMRVEVVRVFEFETNSLLYESDRSVGSQAAIDQVFQCLQNQPQSMANGDHLAFIKKMAQYVMTMAKRGMGFYGENKNWINPMAASLGSLLL